MRQTSASGRSHRVWLDSGRVLTRLDRVLGETPATPISRRLVTTPRHQPGTSGLSFSGLSFSGPSATGPASVRARARATAATFLALVAMIATTATPFARPAVAGEPVDRLPDLRLARNTEFRIQYTGGRRLLRYSSLMLNLGQGPMEVNATRPGAQAPWNVDQVVFDAAGGSRRVDTTASMNYAGDGHNHWHVTRMVDHDLWSASRTLHGPKVGFCFFDTNLIDPDLPNSPAVPVYRESWCGRQTSLSSRIGISVGWGDRYQWQLPFQWIDITGLPGGTYTLRSFVDARNQFLETADNNNCTFTRVRFNATGTAVTVVSSGSICVDDWTGTTFVNDIQWLFEHGLTSGCGIDLFCPAHAVTRAEMASFLARALALPPSTADAFTDDNGSTHEADINALAEAGVTAGCSPTRYCPTRTITRAEMASFLARALQLPPSATDRFTDDAGLSHEPNINAIAAAGITTGCSPTTFCPARAVTRGEMAAFLRRSFD
jgi:hypothetical protein